MKTEDIKPVHNWTDMAQFGIGALTGERDGYGLGRILCDLTWRGVERVTGYMGIPHSTTVANLFEHNWNSQVGEVDAVRSVMLHRDQLEPLAVFCMLESGAKYAYVIPGTVWCDNGDVKKRSDKAWEDAHTQAQKIHAETGGDPSDYSPDWTTIKILLPHPYWDMRIYSGQGNFNQHSMSGRP